MNLARRRLVETGEQMNQGALATTTWAGHRDKLVPSDLERHPVERVHGSLAAPIFAGDVLERDQASFIRHRIASRKRRRNFLDRRRDRGLHRGRETAFPPDPSE